MGIVAFCPQGHRVKVKDELAGRKGICPECGARFRIPHESASAAPVAAEAPRAVASPASPEVGPTIPTPASPSGTPVARIVSLDPALAATLPRAIPLARPDGGPAAG